MATRVKPGSPASTRPKRHGDVSVFGYRRQHATLGSRPGGDAGCGAPPRRADANGDRRTRRLRVQDDRRRVLRGVRAARRRRGGDPRCTARPRRGGFLGNRRIARRVPPFIPARPTSATATTSDRRSTASRAYSRSDTAVRCWSRVSRPIWCRGRFRLGQACAISANIGFEISRAPNEVYQLLAPDLA